MNRVKAFLPLLVFSVFATPIAAHAATLPLFSSGWSIVPPACQTCACSLGGVLQILQNTMNVGVSLAVLVAILVIVYAGVLLIMSPMSPENRSTAKKMLINAFIGLVIALAAWLIVDFVMKAFYNPGATFAGSGIGPWNAILTQGVDTSNPCVQATIPKQLFTGSLFTPPGVSSSNTGGTSLNAGSDTGACDPTAVQAAAQAGGATMTTQEADTLACVAGPESTCGSVMQNYNWDAAKAPPPSTAYGPFQITLKGNSACLNNSACEQAAGVTGPLNCNSAFTSAGYSIPGQLLNECKNAAANFNCSAAAADCVYKSQGVHAWTKDPNSAKQQACITKYGG